MPKGTVETYLKSDGTGTICADDGGTYFVHRRDIQNDPPVLAHGDRVAFDVCVSDGEARAIAVRRVEEP